MDGLMQARPPSLRTAIAVPAFGFMHTLTCSADLPAQVLKAEGAGGLFRGVDGAVPRVMVGSVLVQRRLLPGCVQSLSLPAPASESPARLLFLASFQLPLHGMHCPRMSALLSP